MYAVNEAFEVAMKASGCGVFVDCYANQVHQKQKKAVAKLVVTVRILGMVGAALTGKFFARKAVAFEDSV